LFPTRSPKRDKKRKTTFKPKEPIIETNFTCPWDADGYYPDSQYCHIYHYCLPGLHTILECATGLWYSEPDEVCLWPSEAKCSLSPSVTAAQPIVHMPFDPLNKILQFIPPETSAVIYFANIPYSLCFLVVFCLLFILS
jgi:hypothetical protein